MKWKRKLTEWGGKLIFPVIGLVSLIWFLIRVIPKPSRIHYPCVQAAAPLASSFVLFLIGFTSSFLSFRMAKEWYRRSKYQFMFFAILAGVISGSIAFFSSSDTLNASPKVLKTFDDPLGPNNPIGEPKGVIPGRVVWVHDSCATNANCTNNGLSDAYFLDKNTNQQRVDSMFMRALLSLTGEDNPEAAWDAVFRYYNTTHDKGDTGYESSETIFIKINAVSAYSGIGTSGEMSRLPDESDTTPQTILAILRQLVLKAGVPEDKIYIGDPMCGVWNHIYDKLHAEFPDVNYVDMEAIAPGRLLLVEDDNAVLCYSDTGSVLTDPWGFDGTHHFFTAMSQASYMINIPVLKGHALGGVTLCAKNHFGSNTSNNSWQLHKGLMDAGDGSEVRTGYSKYRVLVDLMGSKYLGGKTMLYFIDGLWSTSYEHQKPQRFISAPFNNHWSSSILLSLDPVAIESVGIDILQKEFKEEVIIDGTDGSGLDRFIFVQWDGVDDHLHQAASSDGWPEGIVYDPDQSGTPISSLGVHEHWNNEEEMIYSGNLVQGEGIELVKLFISDSIYGPTYSDIDAVPNTSFRNYPNPFSQHTIFSFQLSRKSRVRLAVFNLKGQRVAEIMDAKLDAGLHEFRWESSLPEGMYVCKLRTNDEDRSIIIQVQ